MELSQSLEERPNVRATMRSASRVASGRSLIFAVAFTFGLSLSATAQGSAPAQVSAPPAAPPTSPSVQLAQPSPQGQTPPATITIKDALDRATKYSADFLAAQSDARSAREDRLQARDAMLPGLTGLSETLLTQGDGKTPVGRYVTNDGVHVYRDWVTLHLDLSPASLMGTGYHHATAAESAASARAEIARRGLAVTVTQRYYGLIVAQRKYATAQEALNQTQSFYSITGATEQQGQGPHSDTIKAEIQYRQAQAAFEDAKLAMEDARLGLGVLLFPQLNENFTVVDDLDSSQGLPPFADVQTMAEKENPDLRVAIQSLRQADLDVTSAKTAFLPTIGVDAHYGIEANAFALHSVADSFPALGVLPNLGYFIDASLNVPIWDWGILRSKLHQSELRQDQARAQLSQTQREVLDNLYSYYNEAQVAQAALDTLRHTSDLAVESLRLVNLRFSAGTSTVLDVVDAETTLTESRNAYDDGLLRYRQAVANLETLTGTF
jgi:outer membrane protein TolC